MEHIPQLYQHGRMSMLFLMFVTSMVFCGAKQFTKHRLARIDARLLKL